MYINRRQIQFFLQHLFQVLSHLLLLRDGAVVLNGQDHWVPWVISSYETLMKPLRQASRYDALNTKASQDKLILEHNSTYWDFVKAYLLIVSTTSLKRILDVKV